MDKHDEIHGFPNGGNNVGVTPGTLVVSAIEADARTQQGESTGGSGLGQSGMSSGGLSNFSLYWDVASKSWKCHEPRVIDPDGASIPVEEPEDGYGKGAYYLHVTYDSDEKKYLAEIKAGGSTGSDDEVVVIKLFTIADAEEETVQYHVGAIFLSVGIIGQEGKTTGSPAEKVYGRINAKGESDSGLVIKTYKSNGEKTFSIDLAGRSQSDSFGIKEVTDEGGNTISKVLATEDFSVGGGSSGSATVPVFTGAEIEVDIPSKKMTIKFTTKTLTVLKVEDNASTTDVELDLEQYDVVESSSYDTGTHEFQNTLQGLVVFGHTSPQAASPDPVFTAKEHSTEA